MRRTATKRTSLDSMLSSRSFPHRCLHLMPQMTSREIDIVFEPRILEMMNHCVCHTFLTSTARAEYFMHALPYHIHVSYRSEVIDNGFAKHRWTVVLLASGIDVLFSRVNCICLHSDEACHHSSLTAPQPIFFDCKLCGIISNACSIFNILVC